MLRVRVRYFVDEGGIGSRTFVRRFVTQFESFIGTEFDVILFIRPRLTKLPYLRMQVEI